MFQLKRKDPMPSIQNESWNLERETTSFVGFRREGKDDRNVALVANARFKKIGTILSHRAMLKEVRIVLQEDKGMRASE